MKKGHLFLLILLINSLAWAQSPKKPKSTPPLARPKLVVGIVVDQMRYDYLYRFYDKYSEGGFKRLLNGGFNCRNNHYHYALTVTAAGHAAIYTGSLPAINGIVGNDWYDTSADRSVYCVEDTTVRIDRFPFIDNNSGGSVDGWLNAAARALTLIDDETVIIPGHGDLATKKDYRNVRDAVMSLRDAVRKEVKANTSLDGILAKNLTKDYDTTFGSGFIKGEALIRTIYIEQVNKQ